MIKKTYYYIFVCDGEDEKCFDYRPRYYSEKNANTGLKKHISHLKRSLEFYEECLKNPEVSPEGIKRFTAEIEETKDALVKFSTAKIKKIELTTTYAFVED